MKTAAALCLLWLVSSVAAAQNRSESSTTNSLFIALENAWNQAQLQHDSKALELLLADIFVSTDDYGTFMTKAEFLEDNKDPSYAPSLMANTDEKVFFYGFSAVVTGIYHAKGLNKGKPFDRYGRFTDTWIYLGGKWLCAATHTSPLNNNRH